MANNGLTFFKLLEKTVSFLNIPTGLHFKSETVYTDKSEIIEQVYGKINAYIDEIL